MWRILRTFAWMRWRVLLNSLEQTGARDRVERLSRALEQIGPLIAYLLLVPSALGLAALGGYTGYHIAAAETAGTFDGLRFLLLAACAFAVVGPLLLPAVMDPTVVVRLLLLPISRRTLYASQVASGLSEPWVLISLPVVLSIPAGLAAAGAWLAAAVSLAAGLLLVLCLIGISTLVALLLHLLVRDRRRGELLTLVFIVVFPAIAMLPGLMSSAREGPAGSEPRRTSAPTPAWVTATAKAAYAVVPAELYARATRSAAQHRHRDAVLPLVLLVSSGAVLHALGMLTFAGLLDSPSAGTRRRPARNTGPASVRLPFLSRAGAAVAQAQLRLAMRTPRGRSIMLSPFAVFVVFAIVMRRRDEMELGVMSLNSGLALATFGGAVCLLSTLPFAMNQFAIDRAGLTLALLAPLDTFELLAGKAVGIGLIAGGPALLVILVALALYPGGPAALWLSLPPALVATYLLAAPGAAALSAVFPRTVDLNSIGKGSNPHSLANLLGLLLFAAAALPGILIFVVTTSLVETPLLTPVVMLAWCAVALLISRVLFHGVVRLFDRRRENLGIVAV